MDKFSRKAKFESVKFDKDALTFHASKYIAGAVYPLAKQCYQFVQRNSCYWKFQRVKSGH
jgi:hypothetical protein